MGCHEGSFKQMNIKYKSPEMEVPFELNGNRAGMV